METARQVIDKIKNLYIRWYKTTLFDSTSHIGINELNELLDYSKQHIPNFKIAMMELLEQPDDMNYHIPTICSYILQEDFIKLNENKKDKLPLDENYLWDECNLWLNHFKSTKDIDYYKQFKEYKKYLTENFKLYNPFIDKDPNITYEEFLKKCNNIDSLNIFFTKLRKDNNIKILKKRNKK